MKKHILVTGSTDGIGKLTAIKLASLGHAVYVHGRSDAKVQSSIADIKAQSNNEDVSGFVADFSDLDQVKKMVEKINTSIPHLDVLINNAGIFKSLIDKTKTGLDIRFTVNYFAPYVLTDAMLPLLKKSDAPRIINLSSAAQASVSLEALAGIGLLSANESYAQSKLALTTWSFALARKYPDMIVIAVNPGSLLNTKMAIEAYGQHWSPAEKGQNILVDLALSENYTNDSGKYFDNDKGEIKGVFAPAHPDSYNADKITDLMKATIEIITK